MSIVEKLLHLKKNAPEYNSQRNLAPFELQVDIDKDSFYSRLTPKQQTALGHVLDTFYYLYPESGFAHEYGITVLAAGSFLNEKIPKDIDLLVSVEPRNPRKSKPGKKLEATEQVRLLIQDNFNFQYSHEEMTAVEKTDTDRLPSLVVDYGDSLPLHIHFPDSLEQREEQHYATIFSQQDEVPLKDCL